MVISFVLAASVNKNKISHLSVKGFSVHWMNEIRANITISARIWIENETSSKKSDNMFLNLILMDIYFLRVGFELRYQTEQVNLLPIWLTINIYVTICFDLIMLPMYCCAGCLASNCNINILCKFESLTAMILRSRTQLGNKFRRKGEK